MPGDAFHSAPADASSNNAGPSRQRLQALHAIVSFCAISLSTCSISPGAASFLSDPRHLDGDVLPHHRGADQRRRKEPECQRQCVQGSMWQVVSLRGYVFNDDVVHEIGIHRRVSFSLVAHARVIVMHACMCVCVCVCLIRADARVLQVFVPAGGLIHRRCIYRDTHHGEPSCCALRPAPPGKRIVLCGRRFQEVAGQQAACRILRRDGMPQNRITQDSSWMPRVQERA